jgi:NADPH:quinone reductase-like Zn-dependent oxidoreductase
MKAILLSRTGGPAVLEYTEVPTPRPGPGEMLVRAHTIGVSMPEMLVRKGTYAWMPPLPAIPGIEMSGTIAECGPGVADRAVGDPVFVSARDLPVWTAPALSPLAGRGRAMARSRNGFPLPARGERDRVRGLLPLLWPVG